MIEQPKPPLAIQIRELSKSFGRVPVLRGIDLDLPWGKVLTVLGPNGSGKTTLIKILATVSSFDSGSVKIGGVDVRGSGRTVRRAIGVVTHDPLLYDELTAYENLRFFSRMYGVSKPDDKIAEVIDRMGMTSRLHDRVKTLSHGMKKRISIARMLLHDPLILVMDEPESGLDQDAVAMLDNVISDRSDPNRTVVMSTHDLNRGVALADRVAMLSGGRIAFFDETSSADEQTIREAYSEYVAAAR